MKIHHQDRRDRLRGDRWQGYRTRQRQVGKSGLGRTSKGSCGMVEERRIVVECGSRSSRPGCETAVGER